MNTQPSSLPPPHTHTHTHTSMSVFVCPGHTRLCSRWVWLPSLGLIKANGTKPAPHSRKFAWSSVRIQHLSMTKVFTSYEENMLSQVLFGSLLFQSFLDEKRRASVQMSLLEKFRKWKELHTVSSKQQHMETTAGKFKSWGFRLNSNKAGDVHLLPTAPN